MSNDGQERLWALLMVSVSDCDDLAQLAYKRVCNQCFPFKNLKKDKEKKEQGSLSATEDLVRGAWWDPEVGVQS